MTKIIAAMVLTASLAAGQTVINGSRAITGTWDASGAAATKPAKSGSTLPANCAAGEMFFRTGAAAGRNLYVCAAADTWRQAGGLETKSITLLDPVVGDLGRVQVSFPSAVTVLRVACSVKGGTSASINLEERAAASPDTAGTAVMASPLVCGTSEAATTAFSKAGIAGRVPLALTMAAVTGGPDTLRVYIEYTVD